MPTRTVLLRALLMAVGVILVGSPGTTAYAQETSTRSLPRVHVFTQVAKPGQPVPPDQAARLDSVKDLREELRKKPGLLELADAPEKADVTVEVLRREAPSTTQCLLTVRVRAAGRSSGREFQGESRSWKEAASLVSDAVRRWVNETYDRPTPTA